MAHLLAAASLALFSSEAAAAAGSLTYERRITGVPVFDGALIPEPFTGGLNSPKPNLADLDGDSDLDLLIVQPDGGLTHYRNVGTPSSFVFRWAADQVQNIDANTWGTLADIDADGDLDLFTDGGGFVVFHRNVGSASAPNWQLETSNFQGITNYGFGNTPSFVNVDGDADLDYLEMSPEAGTVRYYRNNGTAQAPSFAFVSNQFGCINTFQDPMQARPGEQVASAPAAPESEQHGISVISTSDIDADLDPDIFIGDLTNPSLWFYRRQPATSCIPPCSTATICYQQVTSDYADSTNGINQARFGDLDADGDLDLVVGVTNSSGVINNLIYYRNIGTPQNASFQTIDFNLIKAIDIGRASHPASGDVDGDGDRDLFLGADDGTIATFWNIGTPINPSFARGNPLTNNVGATIDVGTAAAPVWIDYEGDGDLDLFVGMGSPARIRYYRNEGTPQAMSLVLRDSDLGAFDNDVSRPDFNATPAVGDLDADGDLDLLVGEFGIQVPSNPRIFYVRNDGTAQNPVWVTVCDNRPATCVFATPVFQGDTAPELFDLDEDGDLDLLVGERPGNLNFYRNTGTPQAFTFVLESETFGDVQVGLESAVEVADFKNDGDADLWVGEQNGGLNYYWRSVPLGVGDLPAPEARARRLEVAPNPVPSGKGATLVFEAGGGFARAGIYTAEGRLLRALAERPLTAGRHRLAWDGRDAAGKPLPPGVYFLRLEIGGRTAATKLVVTQ